MEWNPYVVVAVVFPLVVGGGLLYAVRRKPAWQQPLAWMGAGVVAFLVLREALVLVFDLLLD